MAEEAYLVIFDIQEAGSGFVPAAFESKKYGTKKEVSVGSATFEGSGVGVKASLQGQGIKSNVATCKLVELLAGSAAEAVEVTRQLYATNAGGERAIVKPNETNAVVVV
jgi:hypothetical protein